MVTKSPGAAAIFLLAAFSSSCPTEVKDAALDS